MSTQKPDQSPSQPRLAKKPYRTPVVQLFGDLADITRTIVGTVGADGGTQPQPTHNRTR